MVCGNTAIHVDEDLEIYFSIFTLLTLNTSY